MVLLAPAQTPDVTVILPLFSRPHLLHLCVKSVLKQTFENWELIVINDGIAEVGRDEFVCTIDAISEAQRAKITYVETPNRGLAGARNAGIRLARGWLIAPLDGDDFFKPTHLEQAVNSALNTPDCDVWSVSNHTIFQNGAESMNVSGIPAKKAFANANQISAQSVFRRSVWEKVGGYREIMRAYEDWDFWLRIAQLEDSKFGRIEGDPSYEYRLTGGGLFNQVVGDDKLLRANIVLGSPNAFSSLDVATAAKIICGEITDPQQLPENCSQILKEARWG